MLVSTKICRNTLMSIKAHVTTISKYLSFVYCPSNREYTITVIRIVLYRPKNCSKSNYVLAMSSIGSKQKISIA